MKTEKGGAGDVAGVKREDYECKQQRWIWIVFVHLWSKLLDTGRYPLLLSQNLNRPLFFFITVEVKIL